MADSSTEPTAVMPKPAFAEGSSQAKTEVREGVLEIPGEWLLHHR